MGIMNHDGVRKDLGELGDAIREWFNALINLQTGLAASQSRNNPPAGACAHAQFNDALWLCLGWSLAACGVAVLALRFTEMVNSPSLGVDFLLRVVNLVMSWL
jgi:hypothetical protein